VAAAPKPRPKSAAAPVSPIHLRAAVRALQRGGVVAYPTEAVWGLGCEPTDLAAAERLFALKGRDPGKGVIIIAAEFWQVEAWLKPLSAKLEERAFSTWPGPVTWLWPASADAPPWITGGRNRIAVRLTAHPVARALCTAYGGAIVSTSANRSGRPPARSATQLRLTFGDTLDAVLPGALGQGKKPTQIRELLSGVVVRA